MPTPANLPFEYAKATDFDPVGMYLSTQKARQDMQVQREEQDRRKRNQDLLDRQQQFEEDQAKILRERQDAARQRTAAENVNKLVAAKDDKGAQALAMIHGLAMNPQSTMTPPTATAAEVDAQALAPGANPASELDFILQQGGINKGPTAPPIDDATPTGAGAPGSYAMAGRIPIPTGGPRAGSVSSGDLDAIANVSAAPPAPAPAPKGSVPQAASGSTPWGPPPAKPTPELEDLMLQSLSNAPKSQPVDPSTVPSRYSLSGTAIGNTTTTASGEKERLDLQTETGERGRFMGRVEDFGRKIMANLTPADAANEGMIAADIQAIREMARVIPLDKQEDVLKELNNMINRRDLNSRAEASNIARDRVARISAGRADNSAAAAGLNADLQGRKQAVDEVSKFITQVDLKGDVSPGDVTSYSARVDEAKKAYADYKANSTTENRAKMDAATATLHNALLTADSKGVLTEGDYDRGKVTRRSLIEGMKDRIEKDLYGSTGPELAKQILDSAERVRRTMLERYRTASEVYREAWKNDWSKSPSLGQDGANYIKTQYRTMFRGIPGATALDVESELSPRSDVINKGKNGGGKRDAATVTAPVPTGATPEQIKQQLKDMAEITKGLQGGK